MRILHLIDNLNQGGEQRQIVELLRGLPDGFEHHVLHYHDDFFFRPQIEAAGGTVHHIPKALGADLRFPLRFGAFLRKHRFDLVHARLTGPSLWGAIATPFGTPLLSHESLAGPFNKTEIWCRRAYLPRVTLIPCNTRMRMRELNSHLGISMKRMRFVPNIWDPKLPEKGRLASAGRRFPTSFDAEHPLVIGTSGRICFQKYPELMAQAIALLPPEKRRCVKVRHCGWAMDKGVKEATDTIIREANLNWEFLGPLPDLTPFYLEATIFALSSRSEGMPNVIQEAGAHGLPVVSTPTGDVPDWITSGYNGQLFPLGDAAAMTAIIADLLENPGQLPTLSANMLDFVARQDPLEGLKATQAVYQEALRK